jgi:putative SOS response-associated peptidase YedK
LTVIVCQSEAEPLDSTHKPPAKQPIHFRLPDYELFAFAGLWTLRADDATGEIIESCTIITTTPNELVAPVHDRMPVILTTDAETVWLDPGVSKEHALSLLQPYPAGRARVACLDAGEQRPQRRLRPAAAGRRTRCLADVDSAGWG